MRNRIAQDGDPRDRALLQGEFEIHISFHFNYSIEKIVNTDCLSPLATAIMQSWASPILG
jgi:hypothetical protein